MPGYTREALDRFQHEFLVRNRFSLHKCTPPIFGAKRTIQYAKTPADSEKLDTKGTHLVQSIAGTFLYYTSAIDSTMMTMLNSIASEQANATEYTLKSARDSLPMQQLTRIYTYDSM